MIAVLAGEEALLPGPDGRVLHPDSALEEHNLNFEYDEASIGEVLNSIDDAIRDMGSCLGRIQTVLELK